MPTISADGRWLAVTYWAQQRNNSPESPAGPGLKPGQTAVRLWNLPSGDRPLDIRGPSMPLGQALSADGNWLVVGYSDGTASVWDLAKRQEVLHWATSLHQFEAIVFAPDGSALALADGLSSLQVLQLSELRRQLAKLGLDW